LTRHYEIYDGYFWTRASTPGAVISTPLSNFIKSDTKEVRIRMFAATGSASYVHYLDSANLELAIDPVYEVGSFQKVAGGTTVNYVSDLIGAVSTSITASDDNRFTIPMPANSQATDVNFTFKNVKKYIGANAIMINPEMQVSNNALTVGVYLYRFSDSS